MGLVPEKKRHSQRTARKTAFFFDIFKECKICRDLQRELSHGEAS